MANPPFEFERITARKPAAPLTTIVAPASGWPFMSRSVPSMVPVFNCASSAPGTKTKVASKRPKPDRRQTTATGASTVNRLIEYPSAPPMKTSDKKWADRDSLENPTSAAAPYATYGIQR